MSPIPSPWLRPALATSTILTLVMAASVSADTMRHSSPGRSWTVTNSADDDRFAYVLVRESLDSQSGSGATEDFEDAAELGMKIGGDFLWFRRGSERYVVRDQEMVEKVAELMEPQEILGRQQGLLGKQQGRLGAEQGRLGRQQAELGRRQARLGVHQARLSRDQSRGEEPDERSSREIEAIAREQNEIGEQQARLGEHQSRLGEEQAVLGEKQAKLGARQAALAREIARKVELLAEGAIRSGVARRVS